jgi:hypothetical protein
MPERFKTYSLDRRAFLYESFDKACKLMELNPEVLSKSARNRIGAEVIHVVQSGYTSSDIVARIVIANLKDVVLD